MSLHKIRITDFGLYGSIALGDLHHLIVDLLPHSRDREKDLGPDLLQGLD